MKNKTNFEKLFGNQPKWMQRLLRERGKDAFAESKHARGTIKPHNWKRNKRAKDKAAKLMRRRNRSAR